MAWMCIYIQLKTMHVITYPYSHISQSVSKDSSLCTDWWRSLMLKVSQPGRTEIKTTGVNWHFQERVHSVKRYWQRYLGRNDENTEYAANEITLLYSVYDRLILQLWNFMTKPPLTHLLLDKMAINLVDDICKCIFLMNVIELWFKFQWNLFPGVQLRISHH